MSNLLEKEHSPYLKQHAHNPVHWMPWGNDALAKAKSENKLIIISIGYSACHWCHVMERESFENQIIADTMNKFYVSVKVDREERPDIDQIYMLAVQLMTNAGGWPLNCICLPDCRPIYGGTYFKPRDWQNILLQIAQMWEENPETALDYASKLEKGIQQAETLPIASVPEKYSKKDLEEIINPWKNTFDTADGGYLRAPKFPLPNNWIFLLRYAALAQDKIVLDQVHLTLQSMANGGIYDQIGGGFSRYSVDAQWHIPHFEKMLYDNAQLISLYTEAYQQRPLPLYASVVRETIEWAKREMLDNNGGFYAALDADSEGMEGKYYMFDATEFDAILGTDSVLLKAYFNITEKGNWTEENTNIPYCKTDNLAFHDKMSASEWTNLLESGKKKLLEYRQKRIRPGLDHKQLTSWNALMIKGLTDAARIFDEQHYLELALQTANFIIENCMQADGSLLHQPEDSNRKIDGFLDDYAFTIESFISIYETTFDFKWLEIAKYLAEKAINLFYDSASHTFFYTSKSESILIARKSEILDNVIPSSSSMMIRQLKRLSLFFDDQKYAEIVEQILANVFPKIKTYGSAYSNWAVLLLEEIYGIHEIALTGPDSNQRIVDLEKKYIPNKIILGGNEENLPLLHNKINPQFSVYHCIRKTCSLPYDSIEQFIHHI